MSYTKRNIEELEEKGLNPLDINFEDVEYENYLNSINNETDR